MPVKEIKFPSQNRRVHLAALAVCPLLALRLLLMSMAFFRSCSVSIRCIFVDSLLDILMALGNLWVIQQVEAHPTAKFPFGFGKSAYLWNFFQGGMLTFASMSLGWESLKSYHQAQKSLIYHEADQFALWSAVITAFIVALEHFSNRRSQHAVLKASMLNHASDLLTYVLGVISSFCLAKGYFGLDYLLALCIVFWMGVSGFFVLFRACLSLMDACINPQALLQLEAALKEHFEKEGGARLKRLRVRDYGQWRQAEAELIWLKEISLREVHQLAYSFKQSMQGRFPYTQIIFEHLALPPRP